MEQDLEIIYFGGAGGFFLLWTILLASQKYNCAWKEPYNNYNLEEVYNTHWNINQDQWKATEIWPDNNKTKLKKNSQNKIYFYCNPKEEKFKKIQSVKPKNLSRIVIYTDIETHIKLVKFKKCFVYLKYLGIDVDAYMKKDSFEYNGDQVFKDYNFFLKTADISIKWQNLIETNGKCLLEKLNLPINNKVVEFVNFYKNQHPKNIFSN